MLDNIREWISDNLRYILLGLAVILLIIIAFFAVRLVTHFGSSGDNTIESDTEAKVEAETEEETTAPSGDEDSLVKDQVDVLAFVTKYWSAIADQDFDTLETLYGKTLDETVRNSIANLDVAVESYDSITTYSKAGLDDGSYIVYVYMELKLTGIETEAPDLRQMYLETDSDGELIVLQKSDYSSEITEYTAERVTDSDVQALIADVNQLLAKRCEEDADLQQWVESANSAGSSEPDNTETDDTDEGDSGSGSGTGTAATGTMYVGSDTGVNVRSEASTDGTILATLWQGAQIEVVENLDNGWSSITYVDSSGSTVSGYVMTQYLSAE